jgi:dTDP-4-dehydrorhamnose reductase
MLGWQVYDYLKRSTKYEVYGTTRDSKSDDKNIFTNFDVEDTVVLSDVDTTGDFDYIINCIGVIKPNIDENEFYSVENAIERNSILPHLLNVAYPDAMIIHASTDCVFNGKDGPYSETEAPNATDIYGKSKALGECNKNMNLRVSIVGHEKRGKKSLLEWFLSKPKGCLIQGFMNHTWNGMTTLQWAKCVHQIIKGDRWKPGTFHLYSMFNRGLCLNASKLYLLSIFNDIYKKNITIHSVDAPEDCERTLSSGEELIYHLDIPCFEKQVKEMKKWWDKYGG